MIGVPRKTTTTQALDELKKRDDLESLRSYLIQDNCFPALKDPKIAPITMEELKKLARVWKLNEKRNFWKNHSERDAMVQALLEHAEQMKIYIKSYDGDGNGDENGENIAMPPKNSLKRSLKSKREANKSFFLMKQICDIKMFNRLRSAEEISLMSRFEDFPSNDTNIPKVVDRWREEDFFLRDPDVEPDSTEAVVVEATPGSIHLSMSKHTSSVRNKVKLMKLRNLAMHIVNYSCNPDLNKSAIELKTIQTVMNIADSDDSETASNCMVAISNISSSENVRSLLFELNAIHKVTTLLLHIRGKVALKATGLMFYYFSIEKDFEDRVYNCCSTFLQANGSSKDSDTRLITLYTLNNLMPCMDRQRAAEFTLAIISSSFFSALEMTDKNLLTTFLMIIKNMCCFSNVHATLVNMNLFDLMGQAVTFAINEKSADLALSLLKIMQVFIQAPADQIIALMSHKYIQVLQKLLHSPHELVQIESLKVSIILSNISQLKDLLLDTRLVETVCTMVESQHLISSKLAKEITKFLLNSTIGLESKNLELLVKHGISQALLELLNTNKTTTTVVVKSIAIRTVQNLCCSSNVAIQLDQIWLKPLIKFLHDVPTDIGAVTSLFNLSCCGYARETLIENKTHLVMLDLMLGSRDLVMKSLYLQVIAQLSNSTTAIHDLLQMKLISKLDGQLKEGQKVEFWNDIALMLLAVSAFALMELTSEELICIVKILKTICVSNAPEDLVVHCSSVLKYVSVRFAPYADLHPIIMTIISRSFFFKDSIVEDISNVLYNMTCSAENISLMLRDDKYINMMIHVMRRGNIEVQESIAQSMRNLSANPICIEILLKTDILSDLIVIALLRTNNEEIKVVCSETFYNMLCHNNTRLKLIQGDLWWAVMRLCRNDSNLVRSICMRALFDLSINAENTSALRSHHVLSFIKDISLNAQETFLELCLKSVHNLIGQFNKPVVTHSVIIDTTTTNTTAIPTIATTSTTTTKSINALNMATGNNINSRASSPLEFSIDGLNITENTTIPLANHEVTSAIRIATQLLPRVSSINIVRDAIILLLFCINQNDIVDGIHEEFVQLSIVLILDRSKAWWGIDERCRFYVSTLLYELSQYPSFTKVFPIELVDAVLYACYDDKNPSFEVIDNIACYMMNHIHRESIVPSVLINLKCWPILLYNGINIDSPVLQKVKKNPTVMQIGRKSSVVIPEKLIASKSTISVGAFRQKSVATTQDTVTKQIQDSRLFSIRSIILCLFAFSISEILQHIPDMISKELLLGILDYDLFEHPLTKSYVLILISALSEVSAFVGYMLDGKIFHTLHRFLMDSFGTSRYEVTHRFCSSFLRNMSLHKYLVPRYVINADGMIPEMIREVLDVRSHGTDFDLAIFFYHSAGYLVKSESALNPKFILDMIGKITNFDNESENTDIANINRYTISMIVNKYSFGGGIDPIFVQYMFAYMQHNQSHNLPSCLEEATFYRAVDFEVMLKVELIGNKEKELVELQSFPAQYNLWTPTITEKTKYSENVILKITQAQPISYNIYESAESFGHSSVQFTKIIKEFDLIKGGNVGGDNNNAITEGDEDDDEVDDEVRDMPTQQGTTTDAAWDEMFGNNNNNTSDDETSISSNDQDDILNYDESSLSTASSKLSINMKKNSKPNTPGSPLIGFAMSNSIAGDLSGSLTPQAPPPLDSSSSPFLDGRGVNSSSGSAGSGSSSSQRKSIRNNNSFRRSAGSMRVTSAGGSSTINAQSKDGNSVSSGNSNNNQVKTSYKDNNNNNNNNSKPPSRAGNNNISSTIDVHAGIASMDESSEVSNRSSHSNAAVSISATTTNITPNGSMRRSLSKGGTPK